MSCPHYMLCAQYVKKSICSFQKSNFFISRVFIDNENVSSINRYLLYIFFINGDFSNSCLGHLFLHILMWNVDIEQKHLKHKWSKQTYYGFIFVFIQDGDLIRLGILRMRNLKMASLRVTTFSACVLCDISKTRLDLVSGVLWRLP